MQLPKRDVIAGGLVIAAVVLYMLWDGGSAVPGLGSTRATGIGVFVLGIAASASAVVPMFDQLIHGNRAYLAVTSLIGAVTAVSGVVMVVSASEVALTMVLVAMVVLWVIATIHHSVLETSRPQRTNAPTPRHTLLHHGS